MTVVNLLLIALVITLEPIPLTAFVLVQMSKGGLRKGAAFIFGWLLSLAVVVVVTLLFTGNEPPRPNTSPSLAAIAFKILVGVVLVGIALWRRTRIGRPKKPKKPPKWQTGIDNMSPWLVIGLAPLTQPWGLVAVGVANIMEAKLSSWASYIALFAFCVVATAVYLVMEIYAAFRPEGAQTMLNGVRSWINEHTDQVIIIISLGLGLWLVGQSIYLLVSTT
jgi:heme/copper-type cytochrome/quinol oxidase subunit 4